MTIVTEDGTGKIDAETYISVTDADAYHSNRNNTAWSLLSTSIKEANLRKATDFMIGQYRDRWFGRRFYTTQALDWPRIGVVLSDFGDPQFGSYGLYQVSNIIVPNEVKNACAELALRANSGSLQADLSQKTIEKTVGPIRVKYDQNATAQKQYVQIDSMLKVYLAVIGPSAKLVRC